MHKFLRIRLSGRTRACACRGVSAIQGSQSICDAAWPGVGGMLGKASGESRARILAAREACLGGRLQPLAQGRMMCADVPHDIRQVYRAAP
jgi:hypothetical protein